MGSMLRSDPMSFCYMYLQPEMAFDLMSEFGEMGCIQFLDLNPEVHPANRNYIADVCRYDEMERRLRFLHEHMIKDNIHIPEMTTFPNAMPQYEANVYESLFEKWESEIVAMSENETKLMKSYCELAEMKYVLDYMGPMLGHADIRKDFSKATGGDNLGGRLHVKTGVIRRSKAFSFEMMLWRVSKGNIFYRQAYDDEILEDPYTGMEVRKVAFIVVCQGEQLCYRLEKVYSGFRVNLYDCPETYGERTSMIKKLKERLEDLDEVIKKTKYLKCKDLRTIAKTWRVWLAQVKKAKAIFHTLSRFSNDISKKLLIGHCWIPTRDVPNVTKVLNKTADELGSNVRSFIAPVPTNLTPPTYYRTNKFTKAFQVLINAYGDSQYRELNPGLYTIITFPFLFSLMFGDCGHAIILVVFASWMICKEKKYMNQRSDNEIWKIFFGGRYVILLLGLFSIYAGLMYNDWFGKALCVMPSYWVNQKTYKVNIKDSPYIDIDPKGKILKPYWFGLDPIWSLSSNKILMQNSIKMKMSIIIGVIHMIFGLTLSLFNYIYFKHYYSVFLQFLPELIFLLCLFFWLVIMIYMKWFDYSAQHPDHLHNDNCAPQILLLFIDMVLMSESKPVESSCNAYMFSSQRSVQMALVAIGVLCIPVLLLGSPLYVHYVVEKDLHHTDRKGVRGRHRFRKAIVHAARHESLETVERAPNKENKDNRGNRHNRDGKNRIVVKEFRKYRDDDEEDEESVQTKTQDEEHHTLSDLMIHQAVHTIEFVLSTISHTASYLRLWALSLAHSQLSDMLWEMVLSQLALSKTTWVGIPMLFVIFAIWAAFTLSILVVMEGLSAFLHTLRLHWVEFMSKFFHGGGLVFLPLSFRTILEVDLDKPEPGCKKVGKEK